MHSDIRREKIVSILKESSKTVSASALAEQMQVSRQVIVSDIALLRAKGFEILSTPKGYTINPIVSNGDIVFKIACMHNGDLTKEEIYSIVDNGGKLIDVIVEHSLYGQLVGQLNICSRYDAEIFLNKVENEHINLLSKLTEGIHLHTISCKDEESAQRIKTALEELKILLT